MTLFRRDVSQALVAMATTLVFGTLGGPAVAATAEDLDRDSAQVLQAL
jgi:hypothetical protein